MIMYYKITRGTFFKMATLLIRTINGDVVFNGEISVKDARENMERLSREYNVKIEVGIDKDFPRFISEKLFIVTQ